MKFFVTSDIHGMYNEFEQLLTYWNQSDDLIILGDLVDRGPQSLDVLYKVMELKENFEDKVHFILGNHEDMLLNFLANPLEKQEHYFRNGGEQTIASFFAPLHIDIEELTLEEQVELLNQAYTDEIQFLQQAKRYEVIENVLFTHAGFDSTLDDFRNTIDSDFIWIRKHYEHENRTPHVNVFGHTPVKNMHESNDIWLSADKKYIGIDGGCCFGGQLNGVLISAEGTVLNTYKVPASLVPSLQ